MSGVGRAIACLLLICLIASVGDVQAQCTASYTLPGGNCEHQGVACAGDVNHDGTADWLVGGHGTYAAVYSGLSGSPLYEYSNQGSYFGISVAGGGDFDGDDFADYAIGECNRTINSAGGRVYLYAGASGEVLHELRAPLGAYNFGCSIAIVGDMNQDGYDEIAVGANCDQTVGAQGGRVLIYSGFDASVVYDLYGLHAGDRFGYSVAAAGDVDRDGYPDVVIGATMAAAGRTYVYSGRGGYAIYALGYEAGYYGYEVAGVGDINNDGYDDFAVGSFLEPYRVTVISGRSGWIIWTIDTPEGGDLFGISIAALGDIDVDGYADFLVGAPNSSLEAWSEGRAYAFSGRTGRELFELGGGVDNAHLGWSVASAGDADHNGVTDLLLGGGAFTGSGESSVILLGTGDCDLVKCCQGKVGDANMSGNDDATLGDISAIIDFLFIAGTPLPCLEEADVNQSGGLWPTEDDITLGDISVLIDHLFISNPELPDCL